MDSENPRWLRPPQASQIWLTVCGRRIRASHALPLQKFDVAPNCCTVCVRMQRGNELLHSRLPTVA